MTRFNPHRNLFLGNSLIVLVAILLLIIPAGLPAGEGRTRNVILPRHPLTLRDCIAIALGESPKLEASSFDLLAAGWEIRAAQDLLWPNLKGSVGGEGFSGESTGKFGIVSTTNPSGGGVNTSRNVDFAGIGLFGGKLLYPIFQDGSIFGFNDAPAVEIKRAERNALAWTAHLTREDVIFRVTEVFIDTVSAQNRVEPVDHRVALLERSVDIHKEEQQKGLLLPADVEVATKQLDSARGLSKILHEQADAGYLGLLRLLGLRSSDHISVSNTLPDPPSPPDAARLFHTMLARHPALLVQLANVNKAKQDYRLENYRLYPSVALHGSGLYVTDFDTDAHELVGGITVSIPIWDFGAQLNTVRARRDTYHAEQARYGAVGNDLASDLVKAYREIYETSESILRHEGEEGKLDRDLRVAQSQQQQGITPPLTVIDAEISLVSKQEELAIERAKLLLKYAELQKAMGGTWKWIP
jgi:outer membrane protein TolC